MAAHELPPSPPTSPSPSLLPRPISSTITSNSNNNSNASSNDTPILKSLLMLDNPRLQEEVEEDDDEGVADSRRTSWMSNFSMTSNHPGYYFNFNNSTAATATTATTAFVPSILSLSPEDLLQSKYRQSITADDDKLAILECLDLYNDDDDNDFERHSFRSSSIRTHSFSHSRTPTINTNTHDDSSSIHTSNSFFVPDMESDRPRGRSRHARSVTRLNRRSHPWIEANAAGVIMGGAPRTLRTRNSNSSLMLHQQHQHLDSPTSPSFVYSRRSSFEFSPPPSPVFGVEDKEVVAASVVDMDGSHASFDGKTKVLSIEVVEPGTDLRGILTYRVNAETLAFFFPTTHPITITV
ncbi:hypothetical protein HDU97_007889 [Phlyctochytrium planicorne]|nr:hypothetical protein HDU97_007889 [Phlyctochytrium planicorne]